MKLAWRRTAVALGAGLVVLPTALLAEGAPEGLPAALADGQGVMAGGLALALLGALRVHTRALRAGHQRLEAEVRARTVELVAEKAEVERQREAAQAAQRDIGVLSDMGRDLMASLDIDAIQRTLCRSVWALMPVRRVDLLRLEPHRRGASLTAWDGYPPVVTQQQCGLDDTARVASRCVREGQALRLRRHPSGRSLAPDVPDWAGSVLAVPLVAERQVIGAILVHAEDDGIHTATHLAMLRSLAGYVAGALRNAEAYQRLQLAQARLVEREKMAALGSLVAGVAHELNTPLGNGVLLASMLKARADKLLAAAAAGQVGPDELARFCRAAGESSTLLLHSLESAATLVSSFKQVAVDQTGGSRRRFDLAQLCDELAATFGNRLRPSRHRLAVDVEPELVLDSHPGALSQVIGNLIVNALEHGFDGREGGVLRLSARRVDAGTVRIGFADDGAGIAAEDLPHVFEPFYTTRLGRGGSGLGLHICWNITTSLLGGHIVVHSAPGSGTRFEITIPAVAPAGAARPPGDAAARG